MVILAFYNLGYREVRSEVKRFRDEYLMAYLE
jgi:hypothetical protein